MPREGGILKRNLRDERRGSRCGMTRGRRLLLSGLTSVSSYPSCPYRLTTMTERSERNH